MRAWEDLGRRALAAAAIGAALWFGARFLLPPLAPFLFAFALAAAMEGPVRLLVRRGMPRRAAAALTTLLALGLICALLWLLAGRLAELLGSLVRIAPRLVRALGERTAALEERAARFAASMPEGFPDPLRAALRAAESALGELPAQLSSRLLALAAAAAQHAPGILLFLISLFLGAFLFSASYPAVLELLRSRLPEGARRRAAELAGDLRGSLGGWLRAQLILAGMCFVELLGLFWLLGVRAALPLAAATALIDALPVFGTGIVLVPWALGAGRAAARRAGTGAGPALRLGSGRPGARADPGASAVGSDRHPSARLAFRALCGLARVGRVGHDRFPAVFRHAAASRRTRDPALIKKEGKARLLFLLFSLFALTRRRPRSSRS